MNPATVAKPCPALATYRGRAPAWAEFTKGPRAGKFCIVVFNPQGQPFELLGTFDRDRATRFQTKERASWAMRELRRRGVLRADESVRLFHLAATSAALVPA